MDDNSYIDSNNRENNMKIQDFIAAHKVPTTSWLIATQFVVDNHRDLDASEYRVRIIELTGRGDELLDREAEINSQMFHFSMKHNMLKPLLLSCQLFQPEIQSTAF